MNEMPVSGELFVNGNFATGDFAGWQKVVPKFMNVVPLDGGHIAVLKPVPYADRSYLSQWVDRERSDGDYVFGFWLRTSAEDGSAVPGVTRKLNASLWVHPYDGLGDAKHYLFPTAATGTWAKVTFRFSIAGRKKQQFEAVFQNERKRPDGSFASPPAREGYETVVVRNDGPDEVAPADEDDDNCSIALRDVTLFRA